ncbi:MAG: hypothetical protein ACK5ZE_02380, partial [Pseudanabaena sp.]
MSQTKTNSYSYHEALAKVGRREDIIDKLAIAEILLKLAILNLEHEFKVFMMPILAVTDTVTTIAEAEQKFGLGRSESKDFFTEWYDHLPKVNSSDRANLEILWQRYIYHCSGGHLLEST